MPPVQLLPAQQGRLALHVPPRDAHGVGVAVGAGVLVAPGVPGVPDVAVLVGVGVPGVAVCVGVRVGPPGVGVGHASISFTTDEACALPAVKSIETSFRSMTSPLQTLPRSSSSAWWSASSFRPFLSKSSTKKSRTTSPFATRTLTSKPHVAGSTPEQRRIGVGIGVAVGPGVGVKSCGTPLADVGVGVGVPTIVHAITRSLAHEAALASPPTNKRTAATNVREPRMLPTGRTLGVGEGVGVAGPGRGVLVGAAVGVLVGTGVAPGVMLETLPWMIVPPPPPPPHAAHQAVESVAANNVLRHGKRTRGAPLDRFAVGVDDAGDEPLTRVSLTLPHSGDCAAHTRSLAARQAAESFAASRSAGSGAPGADESPRAGERARRLRQLPNLIQPGRGSVSGERMSTGPSAPQSGSASHRRLGRRRLRRNAACFGCALAFAGTSACLVGPSYSPPAAPLASAWLEAGQPRVRATPAQAARWWTVFGDERLTRLVETAYGENLSLRAAGLRVIEAQARRAIAIGRLFPEQQALSASYSYTRQSANTPFGAFGRNLESWRAGFDVVWELDLWGKFRRAVEAADADLLAAVASYDGVLVSLVAEVAATYVQIRVLDERLKVAADNVRVQHDSLDIARVRFEAGGTSELDVQQATALLRDTEATIPALGIQRRQAENSLSLLLGMPPSDLTPLLGEPGAVPRVPATVAVGIPAALLRRRPDVRSAEQAAAAQSARVGVAAAELLPALQLTGSIGLGADDAARFFEGRSLEGSAGPAVRWPILNYGRLINNVRLQDATLQERLADYAATVLTAQREVENALVGYLRGSEQVERLAQSVAAANRAVEISLVQYREGATDFTSVLNTQQAKLREDDLLASTRGAVALSAIGLYKALGGGWEIRDGRDFVPERTRREMRARTHWGSLLPPAARQREVAAARSETAPRRRWQWRVWWPRW